MIPFLQQKKGCREVPLQKEPPLSSPRDVRTHHPAPRPGAAPALPHCPIAHTSTTQRSGEPQNPIRYGMALSSGSIHALWNRLLTPLETLHWQSATQLLCAFHLLAAVGKLLGDARAVGHPPARPPKAPLAPPVPVPATPLLPVENHEQFGNSPPSAAGMIRECLPGALRACPGFRAEADMAALLTPELDGPDTARSVLKARQSEASLPPDPAVDTLTVRLLLQASRDHDAALVPLLAELNRSRPVFPGTDLRLVYESRARPPSSQAFLRPRQPASQRNPVSPLMERCNGL